MKKVAGPILLCLLGCNAPGSSVSTKEAPIIAPAPTQSIVPALAPSPIPSSSPSPAPSPQPSACPYIQGTASEYEVGADYSSVIYSAVDPQNSAQLDTITMKLNIGFFQTQNTYTIWGSSPSNIGTVYFLRHIPYLNDFSTLSCEYDVDGNRTLNNPDCPPQITLQQDVCPQRHISISANFQSIEPDISQSILSNQGIDFLDDGIQ